MAEIRQERNINLEMNKDSEYKEIIRQERIFPSLMISKTLEKNLPFKSKSKTKSLELKPVESEENYLKKFGLSHKRPLKSILSGTDKDVYSMLQRLQTIKNLKEKKTNEVRKEYEGTLKEVEDKRLKKQKKAERIKSFKKSRKHG